MPGNFQPGLGGGGGSSDDDTGGGFDPGEFVEDGTETALGVYLPGGQAIGGRLIGAASQLGWQNVDSVSQMLGGPDLPSSGDNPAGQDAFERFLGGGPTEEGDFNLPGTDEDVDLPSTQRFWMLAKILVVVLGAGGLLYLLRPLLTVAAGVIGE